MSTMFALVLTVSMLTGGNQDVLLGVYDSENDLQGSCSRATRESRMLSAERCTGRASGRVHGANVGEKCRRNAVTAVKQSRENQW